jgi:hypothetical protein
MSLPVPLVPLDALKRHSRLAREIADGQLLLKGDSLVRYNFALYSGNHLIPLYGIRSTAPHALVALRAWNRNGQALDPATGCLVPTAGRRFRSLIQPGSILFLVEFDQAFATATDKIAFRPETVVVADTDLVGQSGSPIDAALKYEEAQLTDVVLIA